MTSLNLTTKTLAILCILATTGCVSMHATKAAKLSGKTICVIDNPQVKPEFRDAYERQIRVKGYETKVVPDGKDCPITTTYLATYGFHWGVYLATAELKVFEQGVEVAKADYNAPFASPEKHGRVEGKIERMVAQLLP